MLDKTFSSPRCPCALNPKSQPFRGPEDQVWTQLGPWGVIFDPPFALLDPVWIHSGSNAVPVGAIGDPRNRPEGGLEVLGHGELTTL